MEEMGTRYFTCEENMRKWNYVISGNWLLWVHFPLAWELKHWNEINMHMSKGQFIHLCCSLCNDLWAGQVQFLAVQDFFVLRNIQTNSGAHPAYYPVNTGTFSWRSKAAEMQSWPLTSICCLGQESGAIPSPPHMSLQHSAEYNTGITLPFCYVELFIGGSVIAIP
jgi:hypothetical protein